MAPDGEKVRLTKPTRAQVACFAVYAGIVAAAVVAVLLLFGWR